MSDNTFAFSVFLVVMGLSVITWGDPDVLDALIQFLMKA